MRFIYTLTHKASTLVSEKVREIIFLLSPIYIAQEKRVTEGRKNISIILNLEQ
jgi:hypothetical protein